MTFLQTFLAWRIKGLQKGIKQKERYVRKVNKWLREDKKLLKELKISLRDEVFQSENYNNASK